MSIPTAQPKPPPTTNSMPGDMEVTKLCVDFIFFLARSFGLAGARCEGELTDPYRHIPSTNRYSC